MNEQRRIYIAILERTCCHQINYISIGKQEVKDEKDENMSREYIYSKSDIPNIPQMNEEYVHIEKCLGVTVIQGICDINNIPTYTPLVLKNDIYFELYPPTNTEIYRRNVIYRIVDVRDRGLLLKLVQEGCVSCQELEIKWVGGGVVHITGGRYIAIYYLDIQKAKMRCIRVY